MPEVPRNKGLAGLPPHYAILAITARSALRQDCDLQTCGRRAARLRLPDCPIGGGQGRGGRSGRLRDSLLCRRKWQLKVQLDLCCTLHQWLLSRRFGQRLASDVGV